MKKLIIIALLMSGAILCLDAQNPYYDALALKKIAYAQEDGKISFETTDSIIIAEILKNYTGETKYYTELVIAFSSNPFIQLPEITSMSSVAPFDISQLTGRGISSLSSIGSFDVTNIADGLAKFLVERVKQELSTSFFEKFKAELEKQKQLQIIFPTTYKALTAIDKEIYNYASYLDLLRDSFQKDLAFLLPNIGKLVEDPCMEPLFTKFPGIKVMLSDGLFLVNGIAEGQFPGEAFHNYIMTKADSNKLKTVDASIYPSLAALDLFSQSLRSRQPGRYWVSQDSLKLLFDDMTLKLYLGLVYQQANNLNINFPGNTSLLAKLEQLSQQFSTLKIKYESYLIGLIDNGKAVEYYFNLIKEKQKSGNDKPGYQDYFSLYDASLNFIEFITRSPFIEEYLAKADGLPMGLDNYFASARGLGNIYVDVYEKQYTSAIAEFTGFFNRILSSSIKSEDEINNSDSLTGKIMKENNEQLNKMLKINALILKYGAFVAAVAKAETSDEVKEAIESAALPAGSSRIKRETPFNVSLNAYTGLFTGWENIITYDNDNDFKLNSYGLAAPIGVAVSHGINHWSLSGFVSVIDIGAIAAFRFSNDTAVSQVPTIQLQDIFSPGLFFSVGIPKCPLSVNLGAQVGPNLRKIYAVEDEVTGEEVYQSQYQDNVYWRFSISLVVDIPIFNFYTKN